MSDLVKRLRDMNGGWASDEALAAADRIEELEKQLRWVLYERDATFKLMLNRAETAEAKLAKAVEVAEKSIKWLRLYGADVHREAATLAELTGGKDE